MVDVATIERLRKSLKGSVLVPGDPGYDEARRVYNAMIDKRPAAIARCAGVDDVSAAVRAGVAAGSLVSIRGGGHNAGGLGVCDGGLVVDLSQMRGVRVDAEARTARVQGGALWGDVDAATHPYGFAVPSGIISSTGVGGLTLGGGTGHLSRRYGLTIDNLLAAEVVLADGSTVRASEDEHPDLFWALRGGGGNFGVVTAFEFKLQPVERVVGGPMLWPLDRARDVLQWYREFLPAAPEELNGFFAFMTVPPVAPFPAGLHGKKVCGVVWCWTGPASRQDEVLGPARALGPVLDGVQEMPFPALQSAFDPLIPMGLQWYWRGDFVIDIPDAAVEEHVRFANALPTPLSTMHLYPMDGAVRRVGSSDTAFSFREARWNQVIVGVDPDPAQRQAITQWTRDYWSAIHPHSAGGTYVNFLMGDEGGGRIQGTFRDNYPRLLEVKRRYDPENRFSVNQNIDPRAVAPQPAAEAPPP